MRNSLKWRIAADLYDSGAVLAQEGRYEAALEKLRRAEDLFSKWDARGRPFMRPFRDGISGLAKTLFLQGQCYEGLGDFDRAVSGYEASLINETFEKRGPFRRFRRDLSGRMAFCYDTLLKKADPADIRQVLQEEPLIHTDYRFPFSLSPNGILIARAYELDPHRHARFREFYAAARNKDRQMRMTNPHSEERKLRLFGTIAWGSLIAIWIAYGLMAVRTVMLK